MVNLGNDEIVKYPFLAEAGKYLSDKGFSLEQFGTDPDLKKLLKMPLKESLLHQKDEFSNLIFHLITLHYPWRFFHF